LASYHLTLEGFTLFGSFDKIAGFEKPLSLFYFITQGRSFSNALDKILLNNICWSSQQSRAPLSAGTLYVVAPEQMPDTLFPIALPGASWQRLLFVGGNCGSKKLYPLAQSWSKQVDRCLSLLTIKRR
jgi:hypothetical protein